MLRHELSDSVVKQVFKEYYSKHAKLELPDDFVLREFAVQLFGSTTYVRHLSFRNRDELYDYVKRVVPLHLYYSSAKYENPGIKDMESKKWLGSDLIFDIDADHIPGCTGLFIWKCENGHQGISEQDIDYCSICQGKIVDKKVLVDDKCLEEGMRQVHLLVDILTNDFGFSKNELRLYFSGHRGYHIHVLTANEKILSLDQGSRREIVDYILGIGLDKEALKLVSERKGRAKYYALIPRMNDYGWRRRIALALYYSVDIQDLVKKYVQGMSSINYGPQFEIKNIDIEKYVDKSKVFVDEKVTIDIHRLIRIPGSLNGKTGLKVELIDNRFNASITRLSPAKGYAIFKPEYDIRGITILGYKLNLAKDKKTKINLGLAIYLYLKGMGVIEKVI